MKLRHSAALVLMGSYLMLPSLSSAAGSVARNADVKTARIYGASENSEAPDAQGNDDSQVRDEIEHEWYLMCPPFTTKPPGVAVNAPFTQWKLGTHWPNRDVCEKQRAGVAQTAGQWATSEKEYRRAAATAMQHCLCFSSNEPRLDQKFVRKLKDFYLEEDYRHGLLKRPPK